MATGMYRCVEATTDQDHREGLLRGDCSIFICCYVNPNDPTRLQHAGSSKFQEELSSCNNGNDTTNDPSAYSTLMNKTGPFANFAKKHVVRMNEAFIKSGQNTAPVWSILSKDFNYYVKCATVLVPGQPNGSGGICTEEHVLNSLVHDKAHAAAAGENRATDSLSGVSYYVDAPPSKATINKLRTFWEDTHGQRAVGYGGLFAVKAFPKRGKNNIVSVNQGPRYKTAPGKCSWRSC